MGIARAIAFFSLGWLVSGCMTSPPPRAEAESYVLYRNPFIWPLERFRLTSYFGKRGHRYHEGVDLAARSGTKIVAARDGRVVRVARKTGYGRTVVVDHGPFYTLYAHLSDFAVKKGEQVRSGEVIGYVGKSGRASGYHLHFEVRSPDWVALNPLDYLPYQSYHSSL